MKKIILILITLFITSCSEMNDVESCRYGLMAQSFTVNASIENCKTIYKEIELSKSKGEKNIENIFRNDSIMINFRLINDVNENYFINKDGTLFYDIMNVTYKVEIRKELFAELLTSLDQQKHNK